MNLSRLILTAAFIATFAIGYFIGGSGAKQTPSDAISANQPAPDASAKTVADDVPRNRNPRDADPAIEPKPDAKLLVAKARLSWGGGMGGMMNLRELMRAFAPLAELNEAQLQEALAEIEKTVREPQQKMMFCALLLGQWAETDGRAAMAYAQEKLEKGSMLDMSVTPSVLGTWARSNPEEAWKWFNAGHSQDFGDRRQMLALNTIFTGMAASNLDTALARAASLDEQSRSAALNGIASSAQDNASRQRIIDRSAGLPPNQRAQVRQNIASLWAMSDPEGAVGWIRSLPADEQKPLRESAGQMMLMVNPGLGAEILLEGAAEKDKPRLYDRVAGQWAQQDVRAAGEWLTKQPQGPELDGARRSFAAVAAQRDPAAALDWARSVQDEQQRAASITQIYQVWRNRDSKAADAALNTSGLSADLVQQLRATKPPASPSAKPPPLNNGF